MDNTADNARNDPKPCKEQFDSFNGVVYELLDDLDSAKSDGLLSIPWMLKVINALWISFDRFTPLLLNSEVQIPKYVMNDAISNFLKEIRKALDILIAIRVGINGLRQQTDLWLDISLLALSKSQYPRAKRALNKVAAATDMLLLENRSVSASGASSSSNKTSTSRPVVSSAMSKSWSATEQLQEIVNLTFLSNKEKFRDTKELIITVFTMSFAMFHLLWIIVAALPCQGRTSLKIEFHSKMLRKFQWGNSVSTLRKRIMELDTTKGGKPGLKEIHDIDKCSRRIISLIDPDEQKREIEQAVIDLDKARDTLKVGLNDLELQVTDLIHKVMEFLIKAQAMLPRIPLQYGYHFFK